ncbi:MAG: DUF4340 domain-containing protein [Bacteroidetes bacterium]|jgi:hypothetical protein|nr:DUF4340 domain-containing protein [Bacteroidota bacterium]
MPNFAVSMKRILILVASIAALILVFLLLKKNINQTHSLDPEIFCIESPEKIDKILLSPNNKKLNYIILYRENEKWFVKNDKLTEPADTHSIRELLYWALKKARVKSPVSDAEKAPVTSDIAMNGVKAVFYQGNSEVKTMYAGNPTPNQEATYMYHPDMERPCIIEIAGFKGYLTPYFTLDFDAWRSPVILDVPSEQIRKVELLWPETPEKGFSISRENNALLLKNVSGTIIKNVNSTKLLAFLERFQNIAREYGETAGINRKPALRDSVIKNGHFFSLEITDINGNKQGIRMYRMKTGAETYALDRRDGSVPNFETDTYWVQVAGKKELWVIQGAIMNSRMKTLNDIAPGI